MPLPVRSLAVGIVLLAQIVVKRVVQGLNKNSHRVPPEVYGGNGRTDTRPGTGEVDPGAKIRRTGTVAVPSRVDVHLPTPDPNPDLLRRYRLSLNL